MSEYLRAVKRGEHILITDRGQVIAELRQPTSYLGEGGLLPAPLAAMVHAGTVQVGLPNAAGAYPKQPARAPEGTGRRLLDELRGEG